MSQRVPFVQFEDPRIKSLEGELWKLRAAMVDLAPEEFADLLNSYYRIETRSDSYGWVPKTVDLIIEKAPTLPVAPLELYGRAYCPLCGKGPSSSFYQWMGSRTQKGCDAT
jgi:hypothetical protein